MKFAFVFIITSLISNLAMAQRDCTERSTYRNIVETTGRVLTRTQSAERTKELAKESAIKQAKLACATENVTIISDWTVYADRYAFTEPPYFTYASAEFRCNF